MHRPHRAHASAYGAVVGGDNKRCVDLVAHLQQHVRNVVGRVAIELAGGFVGQNQLRSCGQHPGDHDALRLAARQFLRQVGVQPAELEQVQGRHRPLVCFARGVVGKQHR